MRSLVALWCLSFLLETASAQLLHRGSYEPRGMGCGHSDNAIFEVFDAGGFDLDCSGSAGGARCIEWRLNGRGSYVVDHGGVMLAYGSGFDTQPGNQPVVGAFPLGFTFNYAGGSTMSVYLAPAGYVYLRVGTNPDGRCCSGDRALPNFLSSSPSFALFGQNLNPGTLGGGTIWFDRTTIGGRQVAYFTWDGVAEGTDPTTSNTCQIQLWSDGACVMCWNGVSNRDHSALVGWSAGGGQPDFGSTDLSTLPLDGGNGRIQLPATLSTGSIVDPRVGLDYFLVIENFTRPTVTMGVLLIGSTPTSIDFSTLGMAHCTLLTTGELAAVPVPPHPSVFLIWNLLPIVPISPSSYGLRFEIQAALVTPGTNALGLVLSDAASVQMAYVPLITPSTGIIVRANGRSTVVDPRFPFWSVRHLDSNRPNIASVTLDFAAATAGDAVLQVFDTDRAGIRFDAGNSTRVDCRGTYRMGSDLTTGLVFAGTPPVACDASAQTGWIGTNPLFPGLSAADVRTLSFSFADFQYGESFEFDCATFGATTFGGGMDGTIVVIVFADGSSVRGELVAEGDGRASQVF